ncbi:hypothetical protein RESH_02000 [Rhodopirellula europaea SH398]|uniref:Uncharacterized protein n=1 Tax=Rhodopirellula europaea SH398 TaxID=1263868 RepID=M5S7H7_9BACT|nr:hypothetical protein RESH_02000 [Rhodopirellula europaea SH398]
MAAMHWLPTNKQTQTVSRREKGDISKRGIENAPRTTIQKIQR